MAREKEERLEWRVVLNTALLMTPRWDHLFPNKRAQGWERGENKTAKTHRKVVGGWVGVWVCVCVCALRQMSMFYQSLCTVLMWITAILVGHFMHPALN